MLIVSTSLTRCLAIGVFPGLLPGYICYRIEAQFHDQVEEALEQIDPSARVRDNGEVYFNSNGIGDHARGHELLVRLVGSHYTILIQRTNSGSGCRPETRGQSGPQDSRVSWNPDSERPLPTCDPSNDPTPAYISLAHELGHADQIRRGLYTRSDIEEIDRRGYSPRIEFPNIGRPRKTCNNPNGDNVCRGCSYSRNLHIEIDRLQGALATNLDPDLDNINVDPTDDCRNITENDIRFENNLHNLRPRTYYS